MPGKGEKAKELIERRGLEGKETSFTHEDILYGEQNKKAYPQK